MRVKPLPHRFHAQTAADCLRRVLIGRVEQAAARAVRRCAGMNTNFIERVLRDAAASADPSPHRFPFVEKWRGYSVPGEITFVPERGLIVVLAATIEPVPPDSALWTIFQLARRVNGLEWPRVYNMPDGRLMAFEAVAADLNSLNDLPVVLERVLDRLLTVVIRAELLLKGVPSALGLDYEDDELLAMRLRLRRFKAFGSGKRRQRPQ